MSKTSKTATETVEAPKVPKHGAVVTNIPIGDIKVKKGFNPRLDLGDITELKANIKEHGVISPITVCPQKEGGSTYFVIAGHRRLAAATELNRVNIPAVIRDIPIDSDEAFSIAVSENSSDSRTALTDLEQANAFKRMVESNGGDGHEAAVAKMVGYSTAHVKRTLKLLLVPDVVRKRVAKGEIGKMAALATLEIPAEVRDRVVAKLPVNVTEADVTRLANEEKRSLRGKAKADTVEEVTAGAESAGEKPVKKKAPVAEKVSNRNVPVGGQAGVKTLMQSVTDIREKIKAVACEVLNADEGTPEWREAAKALAALLWVVGSVPDLATDSDDFKAALDATRERIEQHMRDVQAGKTKAKGADKPVKARKDAESATADDEDEKPEPKKPSKKAAKAVVEDDEAESAESDDEGDEDEE